MWIIIRSYGIPVKYIQIIKELYRHSSARVKLNGTLTNKIKIENGMRKGCILSPTLFLILIDPIMKNATNKTSIHWNCHHLLEDLDVPMMNACLLKKTTYAKKR